MKNQQRKRIVLASVLKPGDDTRMFEKMAVSLADSGAYEVTVIGYPSKRKIDHLNVRFVEHKRFKRISFGRLITPLKVFIEVLKVKPEALIINTHELLIVGFLNRILFGTKIAYDIQENYYRNLLHTSAFPPIVRTLAALWVRLKEKLLVPFFHWSFLAEKGYEKEISFFGEKYSVLENKVVIPKGFVRKPEAGENIHLLFSGTLAESTGVFQAINLAKILHDQDGKIRLLIIGYCAQTSVLMKIKEAIKSCSYIELIGGNQLVPHDQIMTAISVSDFGIICYPTSAHTINSIPTKLYEYLGCQLPIFLQNHKPWTDLCAPSNAAVSVNFEQPIASELIEKMKAPFYTSVPQHVIWNDEEEKLLSVIERLVK